MVRLAARGPQDQAGVSPKPLFRETFFPKPPSGKAFPKTHSRETFFRSPLPGTLFLEPSSDIRPAVHSGRPFFVYTAECRPDHNCFDIELFADPFPAALRLRARSPCLSRCT